MCCCSQLVTQHPSPHSMTAEKTTSSVSNMSRLVTMRLKMRRVGTCALCWLISAWPLSRARRDACRGAHADDTRPKPWSMEITSISRNPMSTATGCSCTNCCTDARFGRRCPHGPHAGKPPALRSRRLIAKLPASSTHRSLGSWKRALRTSRRIDRLFKPSSHNSKLCSRQEQQRLDEQVRGSWLRWLAG